MGETYEVDTLISLRTQLARAMDEQAKVGRRVSVNAPPLVKGETACYVVELTGRLPNGSHVTLEAAYLPKAHPEDFIVEEIRLLHNLVRTFGSLVDACFLRLTRGK